MHAIFCDRPLALNLELNKLADDKRVKSVLFFKTNDDIFLPEIITPFLRKFPKPLLGGVFHRLIFDKSLYGNGVLLIPLPFKLKVELFDFEEDDIFTKLKDTYLDRMDDSGSMFVFTDAFADAKSVLVEQLFNFFGSKYSFLGAGCGSDSYTSFPCVITNSGVYANAAVVGYTDAPISLGVSHGWKPVSVPLKVTEATDNKILTINWEPAFKVYQEIVRSHCNVTIESSNFLEVAKSYPIGMMRMDEEMVVRDPFQTVNGEIHCVDNVEAGQYIMVLNGTTDSLLDGARKAARNCCNGDFVGQSHEMAFCIDCFSRVQFLDGDFRHELDEIARTLGDRTPVYGVVSFGEIANLNNSFLEIYNKTVIVAQW